jgi:hypothetical protein
MKNDKKSAPTSTSTSSASASTSSASQEGRAVRYKEVFVVEDVPNRRSRWTRVGVAFENRDGSWNLKLSAVPIAGAKMQIRDPQPQDERDNEQAAA